MIKVAITIPTMNRPDLLLRQFEFCELMNSPHPIYVLDSSNEENAEKIKNEIKKFKTLDIFYKWVPPGKDCFCDLLPLVKEKYCLQMGDDDLIIPNTISECADFLEHHPDYATCAGKQVNIRFRKQDNTEPFGIIDHQTLPFGRSIEDNHLFTRVRNFWSDPNFICFAVTRYEVEQKVRNITRFYPFMENLTEFVIWTVRIISGKAKVLDQLGYIMQKSNNRYNFTDTLVFDFMLAPATKEKWDICQNGLSEILQEKGILKEDSLKMAKGIFLLYLARQFTLETDWLSIFDEKKSAVSIKISKKSLTKRIKHFMLSFPLFKLIYYKFKAPQDVTRSESKYFNDFKRVKDFLEK